MLVCLITGPVLMITGHRLADGDSNPASLPAAPTTEVTAMAMPTLSPHGLGPITLGMDWPEALAEGVTQGPTSDTCEIGTFAGAIVVATGTGPKVVSSITLDSGKLRTSNGVRVGATEGDVLARYPGATRVDHAIQSGTLTFGIRDGLVNYIRASVTDECG